MLHISKTTNLFMFYSILDQTTTWGYIISGIQYCTPLTEHIFWSFGWNIGTFGCNLKLMSHILNPIWRHVINPRQPTRGVRGYNSCTVYSQFFSPVKHWLHCQWAVSNSGKIHQVKINLLYGHLEYVNTQSIYMLNLLLHCYHFQVNMSENACFCV